MDIIFINDFRIDILIGIYERERRIPQTVQIDLEIGMRDSRAGASDDIGDAIDYARIVARIEQTLAENRFSLLEKLAEHIARLVLGEFGSPWVRVSVAKLAPLRNVKRLGVTIERGERA